MDKKSFSIGFLIITAGLLLAGLWSADTTPVHASTTVRDRDFQLVTAKCQPSGEALYVLDNRSGMMAVFAFEPGRGVQARAVGPVADAFTNR